MSKDCCNDDSPTSPASSTAFDIPIDGAVRIELEEGIPIFRASVSVQDRIEALLTKEQETCLNDDEEQELDAYEEIDDYLSFVNRTIRNPSV